jgi:D-aminopeptidase
MPMVLETIDGLLEDIKGFYVKAEHVRQVLCTVSSMLPQESSIGGGCGMICHEFKGGISAVSQGLPQMTRWGAIFSIYWMRT